ncbi:MAG: serine/threonine-protein kinase [Steroidobacteraceae bacterium]
MSTAPPSDPSQPSAVDMRERIALIVRQALEFGPRDRVLFVRQRCADDSLLYDAVLERLLERDDSPSMTTSAALEDDSGVATEVAGNHFPDEPPDRSGERVGTYRLLSRIGLGGMGAVYLAERDDATYRQRVAIKLVNEGLYGSLTAGRLRAERQMLASLDHPNIARVLDGGTASDGTPYFVMEYVDGVLLHAHCDSHHLDVTARLKLFRAICAAVHCAHQNLIVHRDLKPSNILVTAEGTPKLLDFGIAKLLDASQARHTVAVTQASVRLMTPHYASPEQVTGGPITTSTDIYALGLLLYELLTGRRAFDIQSFRLKDIERVLTTTPVVPPSTAVLCKDLKGDLAAGLAAQNAAARSTPVQRLHRQLRGDLDVIVLKALQIDPERRYVSVEQFSRDVEHFLAGRPIVARRDTWRYRTAKFVQRYRLGVAASAVILLLLVGFAATMYVQAGRIASERDRASAEGARAETVSSFLVELFELSDPGRTRGATITAREILDTGARRVTEGLRSQPATQATLLETIGKVYVNLGLYGNAVEAAQRVLDLRRQERGADHPEIVAALTLLGGALLEAGDFKGAEPELQEALAMQRRLAGSGSADEADIVHTLGRVRQLEGRYTEAEKLYNDSLKLYTDASGGDTSAVSSVMNDLAQVLERRADLAGAVVMTREALAMDRRLLGPDHPRVGQQLHNLAYYLYQQGSLEEAAPLFEESLALLNRVVGAQHPDTIRVLGSYGRFLERQGRFGEADKVLREALARQIEVRGEDDYEVAYDRVNLALLLEETGAYAGAIDELRTARRIFEATLPADHQYLASALTGLGRVLATTGRGAEATPLLERALAIWQAQLPPTHPQILVTRAALARAQAGTAQVANAMRVLKEVEPLLVRAYGPDHVDTRRVHAWLGELVPQ